MLLDQTNGLTHIMTPHACEVTSQSYPSPIPANISSLIIRDQNSIKRSQTIQYLMFIICYTSIMCITYNNTLPPLERK